MALVSFLPANRVPIPHEPGEWMEFRKPPNGIVREARKKVDQEGRRGVADFGAEIVKAMNTGSDDDSARVARRAKQIEKAAEYDVAAFDRDTLLNYAIVAWSYVDPRTNTPVQITPAQIADNLDEPTAFWAHQVVVDLIKPPTAEADKSGAVVDSPGA